MVVGRPVGNRVGVGVGAGSKISRRCTMSEDNQKSFQISLIIQNVSKLFPQRVLFLSTVSCLMDVVDMIKKSCPHL